MWTSVVVQRVSDKLAMVKSAGFSEVTSAAREVSAARLVKEHHCPPAAVSSIPCI